MLIAPKNIVLNAFKRMAETGLLDKDYLMVKLQAMLTAEDVTQEDIQPIVDILYPPETPSI